MNWLLKLIKDNVKTFQLQAVLHALICGENITEGIEIPVYIYETFKTIGMPNYICDALKMSSIKDAK